MKWLRSSLFKNNSDTFTFEEKINIDIKHYDPSLKNIKDAVVQGVLTRGGKDKIYVDLKISGIFEMISARTLNVIDVPFEIAEKEEFIDKMLAGSDTPETNLIDMYIDIAPLVEELIILNIPITSFNDDETLEVTNGNSWSLVSEDEANTPNATNSPFAALGNMFNKD